ncbi:hypothetical protein CDAR_542011 [Caerostris darwini]|uniref:Uncharacterized protein n=1 Tax=Caerostris darwini TaxID=1538125 RepID=A0AAV4UU40_9ARAC|nr:hypothetical protein CDAR_542011 [Caerostris darwini]
MVPITINSFSPSNPKYLLQLQIRYFLIETIDEALSCAAATSTTAISRKVIFPLQTLKPATICSAFLQPSVGELCVAAATDGAGSLATRRVGSLVLAIEQEFSPRAHSEQDVTLPFASTDPLSVQSIRIPCLFVRLWCHRFMFSQLSLSLFVWVRQPLFGSQNPLTRY